MAALGWGRDHVVHITWLFSLTPEEKGISPTLDTRYLRLSGYRRKEKIDVLLKDTCFWIYGNIQERSFLGIISNKPG